MNVTLVTCFYGRHEKVERIIRCFLDQTYTGTTTLLLFNNSEKKEVLDNIETPPNKRIIVVNNHIDLYDNLPYKNVGDIFRDAIKFISWDCDVVTFFDSDDIFLPRHVEAGVDGMKKALSKEQKAYKPYYSYFLYGDKITKEHNNLEPSIFIDVDFVRRKGFHKTSASYHNGWLNALKEENLMFIDKEGESTLIYDWGTGHNTFKISGAGDDTEVNFKNHRKHETDFGDGVLSPAKQELVEKYYKMAQ